jgi:hypothetical protein
MGQWDMKAEAAVVTKIISGKCEVREIPMICECFLIVDNEVI